MYIYKHPQTTITFDFDNWKPDILEREMQKEYYMVQ